jgi:CHAT domain-containing protein
MGRFTIYILAILVYGCHNNDKGISMPQEGKNSSQVNQLPDIEKKIALLLNQGNGDSLYKAALQYKRISASAGTDTAWATLFTNIYNSLYEKSDTGRFKYLYAIVDEKRLADADTIFELKYVKALGRLAYENENDYPVYVGYLEKIILRPRAIKTLGPDYEAWVTQNLGEAYTRLNDNVAGLYYLKIFYAKCAFITKEDRDELSTKACFGIGNTLRNMGNYDSALVYTKKALTFKNISRKTSAFATAALAEVYHDMSNPEMSALTAMKSIKLLDQLDENEEIRYRKAVVYSVLADAMLLNKDPGNSIWYCNLAIDNFSRPGLKISREKAKVYLTKARAFTEQKKYDSAFFAINYSLNNVIRFNPADPYEMPLEQDLTPENTIYEALDYKASLMTELQDVNDHRFILAKALNAYELSFAVEKKLMNNFLFTNTTLFQLNESRQRSQKAINLCYRLYQITKDNQWAQKAFEFAEKNKAFVLLESVKRNLAANSALQNDTLYQKVQALQLQLAYTERSLAEATSDSAKQKIQQQKIKLENDLLFANTALGRQSIAYKTVMEKEDSISAASVSAGLLNEHTGLIEFFNADTVTYGFVLNKNQPIQFIRYNATMSAEIDSLLYFFKTASAISNQPMAYQKMAYQLYRTLQFDQLNKGWQNLIIIPDGKLSFLPFDALITNTSFTVNLQQASYFINQCNTLYGYSAAILLKQLHNNTSQINSTTVFAPVFSNNENHQQPLLYSLQEAEAIGSNKNTTSFVKEKATLGNFKQQFANSGILHIATHAYADTGANSNPKIEFIDSSLLLNELYAMHTNASLVVLSACETGLGRLNSSEGPMSLARGFYYAGAQNVITSYWNVDDKSTAALFSSVYKNMENSSSSDAIYLAKKELIKNENGKFASPYYWAGFVHIGMPQKKAGTNYWWALLILPALIAFYYLLKPKRQEPTSTTLIP